MSEKPFLEVVDLALPYIKEILEELCKDAKLQMKSISSDQLGSWDRAVTTYDGCWQIRGHFQSELYLYYKKLYNGWSFVLWASVNEGC